ncbi:hypothetical protein, partial [Falsarthrobacter nasiphocae]|uniref:hypothetical protein n=1 Tax=Falsarthrobacter nasiphocae TaxID=189863 RepID=UPI0031D07637
NFCRRQAAGFGFGDAMLRLLFIALLGAAPVAVATWYSWPQLDELHSIGYPLERLLLVGAGLSWLLVVVLGSMLPLLRWIEDAERERIQHNAQRDMAEQRERALVDAETASFAVAEAERLRGLAERNAQEAEQRATERALVELEHSRRVMQERQEALDQQTAQIEQQQAQLDAVEAQYRVWVKQQQAAVAQAEHERDQAREMMRNRLCGHERRLRQATGHEHMDFETLKMISPPRPVVRGGRHAAS